MKSVVIGCIVMFFGLQSMAQTVKTGDVAIKSATTAGVKGKQSKKEKTKTLNHGIVMKERVVNGVETTTLIHEQEYTAKSKFERMLQKRLQIDAARSEDERR